MNYLLFFLLISFNLCGQEFSINNNFLYNNISYFSPTHTAINDTAEAKMIFHKKFDSPDISCFKISYETPLFDNKIGFGVSAGYENYLLDWVHHYEIQDIRNTFYLNSSLRYSITEHFFVGGKLDYFNVDVLSKVYLDTNDVKISSNSYTLYRSSIGLAYKKKNFSTSINYNNANNPFISIFLTNAFKLNKNVFQPYFLIDMYSFSFNYFFNISINASKKYGIHYKRNRFLSNVEFVEKNMFSLSVGYSFFNNSLRLSLSYFFRDFITQPNSVFNNENLNFSNCIIYHP